MNALLSRSEAIRFLREAEEALDQAHASMKDARIDGYTVATGYGFHSNVKDLRGYVAKLISETETAECGVCNAPLHDGPCAAEVQA